MATAGLYTEEKDGAMDQFVCRDSEVVVDLSGRKLKRLEKLPINQAYSTALILDNNFLQNLSNLDSYGELERLSAANNQILRMYWFARMYSLRILNLPNNNIMQVEGLRELSHLVFLNLAGNNLKNVDGLNYNLKLEHLNLSGNFITHVGDLSSLKCLKELFLHRNRISTLIRCNRFLPPGLVIITLSDNAITDLNDLCNLSQLANLEQLTLVNNPCLDSYQPTNEVGAPSGPVIAYDYRPYAINWCLNLKVLDGSKVTPKESLKAEWLYSQGKGRSFQMGEHEMLVQYLSGVCLPGGGWGGAELPDDDEKLAKILQLAKQHQHDLRHSAVNGHEMCESTVSSMSRSVSHHESPEFRRRLTTVKPVTPPTRRNTGASGLQHPSIERESHHRSQSQSATPHLAPETPAYHVELSSTLYGGELKTPETPNLMTQSMDPSLLAQLVTPGPPDLSSVDHEQIGHDQGEHMTRSLTVDLMTGSLYQPDVYDFRSGRGGPENVVGRGQSRDQMSHSSYGPMSQSVYGHMIGHYFGSMSQSLGTEMLAESVAWTDPPQHMSQSMDSRRGNESSIRPTRLFSDGRGKSSCSPQGRIQAKSNMKEPVSDRRNTKTVPPRQAWGCSPAVAKVQKVAPQRPTSAPQSSPRLSARSGTYVARPRVPPMKSPAVAELAHGSRSRVGSAPSGAQVTTRPRPSPRSVANYGRCISNEPLSRPRYSDGESDNESEISTSKLETIKTIAAQRRSVVGHETAPPSRLYDPSHYKEQAQQQLQPKTMAAKPNTSEMPRVSRPSMMRVTQATVTLQKYWRGFLTRRKNPKVVQIRQNVRESRAEQHIRQLTEKLRQTEEALEKEKRLRHMQVNAIRSLWREIQKLQCRQNNTATPSTPMTPLTPLTPMEVKDSLEGMNAAIKAGHGENGATKQYSEESVRELTQFCSSLQEQVGHLENSLSMVTQVMTAFCNLPATQSLLTLSQSTYDRSESPPPTQTRVVSLDDSVASLTTSIRALTTSIGVTPNVTELVTEDLESHCDGDCSTMDAHSTAMDVSTMSVDSETNQDDCTRQDVGDLSEESSQSSGGAGGSGGHAATRPGIVPPHKGHTPTARPSSLPVPRPVVTHRDQQT